jgi:hypothetical protein
VDLLPGQGEVRTLWSDPMVIAILAGLGVSVLANIILLLTVLLSK